MSRKMFESPEWTGEEYQFIIDHWQLPGVSAQWICDNKPGTKRTLGAIHQKAYYLGVTEKSVGKTRTYLPAIPKVQIYAAQNCTRNEIAYNIYLETGLKVSHAWCIRKLMEHFPHAYRVWKEKESERRSEAIKKGKRKNAKPPCTLAS